MHHNVSLTTAGEEVIRLTLTFFSDLCHNHVLILSIGMIRLRGTIKQQILFEVGSRPENKVSLDLNDFID